MSELARHELHGHLDEARSKQHVEHTVEVPSGAGRLRIAFEYDPPVARGASFANQLSISVYDEHGFRGTRHNHTDQHVDLGPHHASPGFLPGPLDAGRWTIAVDTHRILGPDEVRYTLDVLVDEEELPAADLAPSSAPVRSRRPGWYRGDLHAHTFHSDGVWAPADLVAHARAAGLDFVTLTDHNTVSGLPELHRHDADDLLTIGGIELTTYWGHALAVDTDRWFDWRVRAATTAADLAAEVTGHGSLFVLAHPRDVGDPECTGCRWELDELPVDAIPAVEVWNGPWSDTDEDALTLLHGWLDDGHRVTATAGSDHHGRRRRAGEADVAANVVWAEELSAAAVVDALRAGRSYLSAGPRCELRAVGVDPDGAPVAAGLGGEVPTSGGAVEVTATWADAEPDDVVRLILDGEPVHSVSATSGPGRSWRLDATAARWCNLEIRAASGTMRALTNPIHLRR